MALQIPDLYRVQKEDVHKVCTVLVDAFWDDPLWRSILKGEPEYEKKFRTLFEIPIRFGLHYGFVYASSPALEGIIIWTPGKCSDMSIWQIVRSGGLNSAMKVGARIAKRMRPMGQVFPADRKKNMKGKPHLYLFMLGVAPKFQGQGYGRKLLQSLIQESKCTKNHIYLEADNEENVALYKKFDFRLINKTILPRLEVPIWQMDRAPEM